MIILVGASASGKTELSKTLILQFGYQKCITTTTRSKRINEVDGIDYHFIDHETFFDDLKQNLFVEVTNYQNNQYGIKKNDIKKDGVIILDPNGANALSKIMGEHVFIVYVQTDEDIRYQRMKDRSDQTSSIIKRIQDDRDIFDKKKLNKIDLTVSNNRKSIHDIAIKIHHAYQNR